MAKQRATISFAAFAIVVAVLLPLLHVQLANAFITNTPRKQIYWTSPTPSRVKKKKKKIPATFLWRSSRYRNGNIPTIDDTARTTIPNENEEHRKVFKLQQRHPHTDDRLDFHPPTPLHSDYHEGKGNRYHSAENNDNSIDLIYFAAPSPSWKNALMNVVLVITVVFSSIFVEIPDAHAGFGPSGGATTSPTAGLSTPKLQEQDLSSKKVGQLIDSTIDGSRLNEFQAQLDSLIEGITNYINDLQQEQQEVQKTTTTSAKEEEERQRNFEEISQRLEGKVEEEINRLERAKSLRDLVVAQEKILESLEAQPQWFSYLAAFCGSIASTLVMHPVDTIKTRLQVQTTNSTTLEENSTFDGGHNYPTIGPFENLYEGLTGNILKEGPPSALYLGVYETVKANLLHGPYAGAFASFLGMAATSTSPTTTTNPAYLLWIYLLAGAAGETVGSVVRAPAEALKSTVQTGTAPSFAEAFRIIILDNDGRSNVIRAWSASLWRDVPFGAIQLAIFELIKAGILNNPNIDFDSSTLQSEAIIGAFAGGCGAFLTNPTDVITTRIITQSIDEDSEPLGVMGMGRLIYEEGGIDAFFAGWQARVLYWAPAISIFLTCYCSVRQLGVRLEWFGP